MELYIRHLADAGLMPCSVTTIMHGIRGYFGFTDIEGLIRVDPAVYARLPKVDHDENRLQGLHRPI